MIAPRGRGSDGQSTVELALALPFVVVLLMTLVQAGLVVRDQIMVTHAAREAVRVAAVSPDASRVERAARQASSLDPARMRVTQSGRGDAGSRVTIRIEYDAPVRVPLIGVVWSNTHLSAQATMRVEEAARSPSGVRGEQAQQGSGTGLVEWLVAVATLRRLHARRAPFEARARGHHLTGCAEQFVGGVETQLGDA